MWRYCLYVFDAIKKGTPASVSGAYRLAKKKKKKKKGLIPFHVIYPRYVRYSDSDVERPRDRCFVDCEEKFLNNNEI